ncbi:DUF2891 domain-containing protein [Olleya sp. HaHaR_3_96]|uniref:DUF2891 domain-containing protein n=1 Tax=Olleya sp. HaHaR_3_96 TaxID=2745560 RepID=UPI001C4E57BC|nr:DUF2891 domain-containing protein [Olleya sp. HaHaR_3_96]QXP60785.1 DUF2891 domain-containing protein [Olleya sp. HaHaR_3_96]
MKKLILILLVFSFSCNNKNNNVATTTHLDVNKGDVVSDVTPIPLDRKKATYLYHFAYDCVDQEYPNKLNQVLGDGTYLKTPQQLHPAFYGCFDWHSSVHGHWTLVTILKDFPDFESRDAVLAKLKATLTESNILKEIDYFDDQYNKTFERTYGWAWLLKLAESLKEWDTPEGQQLSKNLAPLTALIEKKCIAFFNKLNYPIRVGEHPNTAFGMSLALDYAKKYSPKLEQVIIDKAKVFYLQDEGCPITWEPGGFDFLSPCLQEASLMAKVLPKTEYIKWLDAFLPNFRHNPSQFINTVEVVDKTDGKMAHLDGLNFSRAWCLYEMGLILDNQKMMALANTHFNASYDKMDSGEYAGAHWLASFALYALKSGAHKL